MEKVEPKGSNIDMSDGRASVRAKLIKRLNSSQMTDFCIFRCVSTDVENLPMAVKVERGKATFTVTGVNLPEMENCNVVYFGKWVKSRNPKYPDLQFRAEAYEVEAPEDEAGLISFLKSKIFPGVGEKMAKAIVKEFGTSAIDVFEKNPNMWLRINGISDKKLGALVESYDQNKAYGEIVRFLAPYGVGAKTATKILNKYGEDAINKISQDPYDMMYKIKGIGFKQADRIARGLGVDLASYKRTEGCCIDILNRGCTQTGDMYMEIGPVITKLVSALNEGLEEYYGDKGCVLSRKEIVQFVQDMIKRGRIVGRRDRTETDPEKAKRIKFLFPKEFDAAESASAQRLLQLKDSEISADKVSAVRSALEDYLRSSDKKLSQKQQDAVIRSLSSRISIITGGPGTGKTTIIAAILYCYDRVFGGEVTLMAPTGKAARRMSEATGRDATTIHSRLRLYEDESGQAGEPLRIESGLVIIDETSMVDNLLLKSMMTAIDTDNCHVIFVGDVDQLPSVGVGDCLAQMINSGVLPTSRLTEIFRQKGNGGTIVGNAAKINRGDGDLEYDQSFMFAQADTEEKAIERIVAAYKYAIKKYGSHEVALLCPLRRERGGHTCVADRLNAVIQDNVNPTIPGKAECKLNGVTYRVGDRVMQWQNGKTSSNGDVGDVVAIKKDADGIINVTISWDNGETVVCDEQDMETIQLAYAISIHKSQGSEYASVIIPMLTCQDNPLFKRNILYTGITRSKRECIIIGQKECIKMCAERSEIGARATLLAQRLQANSAA